MKINNKIIYCILFVNFALKIKTMNKPDDPYINKYFEKLMDKTNFLTNIEYEKLNLVIKQVKAYKEKINLIRKQSKQSKITNNWGIFWNWIRSFFNKKQKNQSPIENKKEK